MTARYPLVINGTSVQEVQSGDSIILDDITVSNSITVSNTSTHTGAVTFSNTIAVTGAATLSNTITVTGNATFSNSTIHTGNATFSNTIAVTGAATFSNTIAVTGVANLSGGISTVRITANNSSNGTSGNVLYSGGASGNVYWGAVSGGNTSFVSLDSSNTFGAILSSVPRQDAQYGFSSSGPWTTFYAYGAAGSDTNSNIQAWHMALGDGMGSSGSSEASYSGNDQGFTQRKLVFASGNRVGVSKRMIRVDSNPTSYSGVGFILMPIRNPTGSTITCSINFLSSYHWSSGYEGASVGYFIPSSTNSPYSTVSGGSWNSITSTTGSSSIAYPLSGSFNIPANTTVIVMGVSSYYYYTSYQFYETSMFYSLGSIYTAGLICDMRMLATLAYGRFDNGYTSQGAHLAYPACASLFGDR